MIDDKIYPSCNYIKEIDCLPILHLQASFTADQPDVRFVYQVKTHIIIISNTSIGVHPNANWLANSTFVAYTCKTGLIRLSIKQRYVRDHLLLQNYL